MTSRVRPTYAKKQRTSSWVKVGRRRAERRKGRIPRWLAQQLRGEKGYSS